MTDGPSSALRIYTDASWNRKRGAWGAVLVWQEAGANGPEDRHRIESGEFRVIPETSTQAELHAVANALHCARTVAAQLAQAGAVHLLVVCDCHTVVHVCRGKAKRKITRKPQWAVALAVVQRAVQHLEQAGVAVAFEWCKGHQREGQRDEHGDWNRLADKAARAANGALVKDRAKANERRKRQRRNAKARKAAERAAAPVPAWTEAAALARAREAGEAQWRDGQQLTNAGVNELCHAILREGAPA
jgi:ribonuclease HI